MTEAQLRTVTAMGALDREQHVVELSEAIARVAALVDGADTPPID